MGPSAKPRLDLASRVLPPELFRVLDHLFVEKPPGCALVGGSALAGFYAGHRRSNDLDLFTKNVDAQKSMVVAVRSLPKIGVKFHDQFHTALYFRATSELDGYRFTIDIVEDENLFRVGRFIAVDERFVVPELQTLLMMKTAALVSRCSEKDLYDLIWLFKHVEGLDVQTLIGLGREIDAGVSGETILMSVSGAKLKEEACDFSLSPKISGTEIYRELVEFRKSLVKNITLYLKSQPAPPLSALVKKLKRMARPRKR